jgi:hypothetical protein
VSYPFAGAGETVSRQDDFALAEQVRSQSDGEHCSTFHLFIRTLSCACDLAGGTGTHRGLAEKESWN